jgi:fatty acid desaturase
MTDPAHLAILRDPRVRAVAWRDLVALSPVEVVAELALPLPWLFGSWMLAAAGHMWLALPLSFIFFLTGLRFVHNAFHGALGLARPATDAALWVMSVLMLGSMHAVKFNHLQHHQHCLDDEDIEGRSAEMSGWGAIAFGPVFPVLLHAAAFRLGRRRLRLIVAAELAANLVWVAWVCGLSHRPWLEYHVAAMAAGQCLTAFFAVWTVHRHCDRSHHIARTLRNRLKNALTFNMFLHIEHHLFPRVPTCHWPALSARLDKAAPELKQKIVF